MLDILMYVCYISLLRQTDQLNISNRSYFPRRYMIGPYMILSSVEFGSSHVLFLKSYNFQKCSTAFLFRASFSDQVQRFFSSVLADATCACLNILSNLFSSYVVVLKFSSCVTCSVQQHISPFAACSGHLGREQ
jgi:hypothetical protein